MKFSKHANIIMLIALPMSFVLVKIWFNGSHKSEPEKWSPTDERNRLATPADSQNYNRRAYQDIITNIRYSLNEHSKLSKYGKGVYINIVDGVIVLSGEVRSKLEQMEVIRLSHEQAGMTQLDNQLKIVPPK